MQLMVMGTWVAEIILPGLVVVLGRRLTSSIKALLVLGGFCLVEASFHVVIFAVMGPNFFTLAMLDVLAASACAAQCYRLRHPPDVPHRQADTACRGGSVPSFMDRARALLSLTTLLGHLFTNVDADLDRIHGFVPGGRPHDPQWPFAEMSMSVIVREPAYHAQ